MTGLARGIIGTRRDVCLVSLDQRRVIVVSSDSSGAIGSKPLDQVTCSPYIVGRFAARVALMETLAVGATPICVAAPLAVEPTPTGKRIVRGIRSEMKSAGLGPRTPLVDSTEKNFKTKQTGVGVSVVGLANSGSLKTGRCLPGDEVFALGVPCVGASVLSGERQHIIADTRDVRKLARSTFIHEIIPVGSKGIIHEAEVMARDSTLQFKPANNVQINLTESAGPSTVILFACSAGSSGFAHARKLTAKVGSYVA